jgi:DNA-3-methyladenine glycosylase I
LTILKKRQAYRIAFKDFAINTVAAYTDHDLQRLLLDTGIVRNRKKIESAITNARAVRAIQKEFGSFGKYIWQFVGALPRQNAWKTHEEIPVRTEQSDAMSSDLRKRGCSFVGSTICYAFMQAVGMVNDHVVGCYRYAEINALHY